MKNFISSNIFLFLFLFSIFDSSIAYTPANTITFDNQSGEFAIVKLVGPSKVAVEVPNGQKRTVNVEAGNYFILGRYGTSHDNYKYTKGDPFDVAQSGSRYSVITITLHKVIDGNYNARPVSSNEFENFVASGKVPISDTLRPSSMALKNPSDLNESTGTNCEKEPVLFLYSRTSNILNENDPLKEKIVDTLKEAGFSVSDIYKPGKKAKDLDPKTLSCRPPDGFKSFVIVITDSMMFDGPFSGTISYKSGNTKIEKKFSGRGYPKDVVVNTFDEVLEIAQGHSSR